MSELASLLGLRAAPLPEQESAQQAYARGLADGHADGAFALEQEQAAHREERMRDAAGFAAALSQQEAAFLDLLMPLLREALTRLAGAPALAEAALLATAHSIADALPDAVLAAHPDRVAFLRSALGSRRTILADASLPVDLIEARQDGAQLVSGVGLRLAHLLNALETAA